MSAASSYGMPRRSPGIAIRLGHPTAAQVSIPARNASSNLPWSSLRINPSWNDVPAPVIIAGVEAVLLQDRRLFGRGQIDALEADPREDLAPLLEGQLRPLAPHRRHHALPDGGARARALRRGALRCRGLAEGRGHGKRRRRHTGQEVSSVHGGTIAKEPNHRHRSQQEDDGACNWVRFGGASGSGSQHVLGGGGVLPLEAAVSEEIRAVWVAETVETFGKCADFRWSVDAGEHPVA